LSKKPLHILEIGTFEGRSAIWILQNLCKHPDSKLYCVDHWLYKGEHNSDTYKTFKKNIEPYKDKVIVLKGHSSHMLRRLNKPQFDFIYIDANRHSQNVLEDAVLSFPLLKPNAIMILDDYTHNKEHNINCPKPGIDAFMNMYANQIKVLHTKWQVVLQKRETPLLKSPCYSEFYNEPKTTPTIYKNINKY
jgi:predicted O-methyltransferase YrrM